MAFRQKGTRLPEVDDAFILPVAGAKVTRLWFSYEWGFAVGGAALADQAEVMVQIGTEFTLVELAVPTIYDPADCASLGPLLRLHEMVVRSALATKSGNLVVEFDDGTTISVLPHPQWEAWQVHGPDVDLIALPGGGLSAPAPGVSVDDTVQVWDRISDP